MSESQSSTSMESKAEPKSAAENESAPPEIRPFERYLLWAAVSFAAFLISLNASLITTALPTISTYFHSVEDIGWYGTAYLLADCSMQPLTGNFYRYLPVKKVFIGFVTLFTFGSIICGVATSSNMLIAGRTIAGLGGSGITNGAMSIVTLSAPLSKRPVIISFLMAAFGLGMVIGPLLGGVITQHVSWRWCFFTTAIAAGFVIIVLVFTKVPDRESKKKMTFVTFLKKLDLVGFAIFAPSCIMLLLAVYYGGSSTYPWKSAQVIGLFLGFGGGLLVFAAWTFRAREEAMVPLSFFRSRIMVMSCVTGFLQMGGNMAVSYFLALWFQAVKGATPSSSGIMILPLILAQVFASGLAGVFTQKTGYYLPPMILGCVLSTIGSGLFTTLSPSSSEGIWIGFQIVAGASRGLSFQAPVIATQTHLPPSTVDVGTAVVFFIQFLGAALFVSFGEAILSAELIASVRKELPSLNPQAVLAAGATGYRNAFSVEEGAVLLGCWNRALTKVFMLAAAAAALSALTSLGMGWKSVKGRKHGGNEDQEKEKTDMEEVEVVSVDDLEKRAQFEDHSDESKVLE